MEADAPRPPDVLEDAVGRLLEAVAVLEAIEQGGMLGALPADACARAEHQRAVSLLAVLRRDLNGLRRELLAAGEAEAAIARAMARKGHSAPRRRARP
jgi:hypothetical protein